MINELISIANDLDRKGLVREADELDQIILKQSGVLGDLWEGAKDVGAGVADVAGDAARAVGRGVRDYTPAGIAGKYLAERGRRSRAEGQQESGQQADAQQATNQQATNQQAQSGGGSGATTAAPPFTNAQEGNQFRKWVNDSHPDVARRLDLDPTGSHNNRYIAAAWKELGQQYNSLGVRPS